MPASKTGLKGPVVKTAYAPIACHQYVMEMKLTVIRNGAIGWALTLRMIRKMSDQALSGISAGEWDACVEMGREVYDFTRLISYPRIVLFSNMWSPEAEVLAERLLDINPQILGQAADELQEPNGTVGVVGPAMLARFVFEQTHKPFFYSYFSDLRATVQEGEGALEEVDALLKIIEGRDAKMVSRPLKAIQHWLELLPTTKPEQLQQFIEAFEKNGFLVKVVGDLPWLTYYMQHVRDHCRSVLGEIKEQFWDVLVLSHYVQHHVGMDPRHHELWDSMHIDDGLANVLGVSIFDDVRADWENVYESRLAELQESRYWQPLMLQLAAQALRRGFEIEPTGPLVDSDALGAEGTAETRHTRLGMFPCSDNAVYKQTDMPSNHRTAFYIKRVANDNFRMVDFDDIQEGDVARLAYQVASVFEDMAQEMLGDEVSLRDKVHERWNGKRNSFTNIPVYPRLETLNAEGEKIAISDALEILCGELERKGYMSPLLKELASEMQAQGQDEHLLNNIAQGFSVAYSRSNK